ncbi:MAG: ATP-dependent DNA ligase [Phycisphaeraceae bacterium]
MIRLAELYQRLDRTTRTGEKLAALEVYFREAAAEDAIWALYFLSGRKIKRAVSYRLLQEAATERCGLPAWLVGECRGMVGDLSETISLLLDPPECADPPALHELVERYLLPLPASDDAMRKRLINEAWDRLDPWQRFVFHKLLGGSLRLGVAQRLVVRGFAAAVGAEPEVVAHRLTGAWEPTASTYRMIVEGDEALDALRPYPFCLATAHDGDPSVLGQPGELAAEWKWDGIRAQLLHRQGRVGLWSRGEESIERSFPELVDAGRLLPEGTVLDGELLAWDFENAKPLGFASLQKRLNRVDVRPTLFGPEVPVIFLAYDLLQWGGEDWRGRLFDERRRGLEQVVAGLETPVVELSELVSFGSWEELAELRGSSRERGVEGLMLKKRDSLYVSGRKAGSWWKWKVTPHTIDAVMVYAQRGHGERAGVFSDYTFAVWDDGGELVAVTKAYSGLTNQEIDEITRWVRKHSIGRRGPVHVVEPELVFEIAFEGIQTSSRHRGGVALRFPRMLRWRKDKKPGEADTLASLRRLLDANGG